MILVDSTVWIDLLRAGSAKPVARLRDLLATGEAAVVPVIVQEILQGAVPPQSLQRLREHFLSLPMLIPTDLAGTHAAAGLSPRAPLLDTPNAQRGLD